jgi:hypothetical protein
MKKEELEYLYINNIVVSYCDSFLISETFY